MDGDEFLKTSHQSKPEHGSFFPSKGEVAVFGAVVQMAADLLAMFVSDHFHGRPI